MRKIVEIVNFIKNQTPNGH